MPSLLSSVWIKGIPSALQSLWMDSLKWLDIKQMHNVHWMNPRATHNRAYIPTPVENIANVLTHGMWVVPSIWGSLVLVQRSDSWPQYWSAVVYGAALTLLFAVSTIFHMVHYASRNSNLRDLLHRGDRAMIYVFIAASYFPWLTLRPLPPCGWAAELRWLVWVLASLGILYQQMFHEKYKLLETFFYLVMGIMPSLAIISMDDFSGMTELKVGGFLYIFGVLFFKSDGKIPCAHAIWHLFVVLAAGVHYYAILNYLYSKQDAVTL